MPRQRDQQVPSRLPAIAGRAAVSRREAVGRRVRRGDDLGDPDRVQSPLAGLAGQRHPDGRSHPEPLVRRIVHGEGVLGDVELGVSERPADYRQAGLVHGQPAWHVGGEPDSQQPVVPDRAIDVGAKLNHVRTVPEQRLLSDPQLVEGVFGQQPGSYRAAFRPHARVPVGGAAPAPLLAEQPRPFAPARVGGVLLLDHELVAGSGEQLGAAAPVDDRFERPAVRLAGPDREGIVLDHQADRRLPGRCLRPGLVRRTGIGT